ncbi:MAG TPA: glycosyltransferase family 4 protein [Stellaceae bacterium]|jgi:glycosyltransferase involved in cell wall biosynthesis|nr:glycosyltransferase family 4 protein [Stellaceae bacterium]
MTADAVGGVWSYALSLCAALPDFRFILATLGPRPRPDQREAAARLPNVVLAESDFRLEWMEGGHWDTAASCTWLDALAAHHGAAIVHVNGYAQAPMGDARPIVAVAHSDVLSWWSAVRGGPAPAVWNDYRRHVAAGLAAADRIVAPTRAVLDDLQRHYDLPLSRAEVISNGINLGQFESSVKRPVVLASGRVWDEAKNLALLDAVAPQLPWSVEIAGEAAHPESGTARLRYAQALGMLAPPEMRRRLEQAAIFAAPACYEPFGLGILEAAAAGCTLVLGDIPSLRESWYGAAVFVPPHNVASWRATLARLIADRDEREELASAARRRARDFTAERTAAAYRALYQDLLARRAPRKVA